MRTALISLIVLIVTSAAHPVALAQSDDAVVVLGVGGVDTVAMFDVAREPEPRSIRLGTQRILPVELGPATIADIKILPDGSALLADVGGRGAAITSPDGATLTFELDPLRRYLNVDSVSVATYFAPGTPSLILVGDSSSSSVSIRGAESGDIAWFRSMRLATSPATIVQAITMPGNRVAIAVEWPFIGVWGIEVATTDTGELVASFVSEIHGEAAADAVVIPEIELLRELVGLPNGNLLVTTAHDVLEIALDGSIVARFSIGDYAEMNGELASARRLASGDIAVATFQPGEWVRPHTNHRVHWLDGQTGALFATSEALTRAPLRVEPAAGSGGTGTFGFDGGLDQIQQGDPTAISLAALDAEPLKVAVGATLRTSATITNHGEFPVGLATLVIRGSVGACTDEPQDDFDFATRSSVALQPMGSFSLTDRVAIDARFGVGPWCLYVEGLDRQSVWRQYGESLEIEVVEATDGPQSVIEVTPLPFGTASDVGVDADPDAGAGLEHDWVAKKGCCATATTRPFHPLLVLGVLVVLGWRRRTVSRIGASRS